MSWSRQLEEDCSTLDLAGETSDDRRIVAIVHISKIIARVTEVRRCLADSNEGAEHVTLHIEGLVASLNDVRTRLNENQSQHSKPRKS